MTAREFPAGRHVSGEDFIGRQRELGGLEACLVSVNNVAVTGLPRIGKSSLVQMAVRRLAESRRDPELRFVQLALAKSQRAEEFFGGLARALHELAFPGALPPNPPCHPYAEIQFHIDQAENSMRSLEMRGIRVKVVVDEFDFAPFVLGATISNVREQLLCSHRFGNLSMVTISQASLEQLFEFELGSDFPGLFGGSRISVCGFDEDDMEAFHDVVRERCPALGAASWRIILDEAGHHPFLLACWANSALKHGRMLPNSDEGDVELSRRLQGERFAHEEALRYQVRAVRRLKLHEHLGSLARGCSSPTSELRDLRLYGLVDNGGRATIPALLRPWAEAELREEAVEEFDLIRDLALSALEAGKRKQSEAGLALAPHALRQLRRNLDELDAVISVCTCLDHVLRLDSGLLRPTAELLSAMHSRFATASQFIERL